MLKYTFFLLSILVLLISVLTCSSFARSKESSAPFRLYYIPIDPQKFAFRGAVLDYDQDGDLDILGDSWADIDPNVPPREVKPVQLHFWRNDGPGKLTEVGAKVLPKARGISVHYLLGDFNGDRLIDIFGLESGVDRFPNPGGQSLLLLNTGASRFRNMTSKNLPKEIEFGHDSAAGDVDRDGDLDIFKMNIGCCWDTHAALGPYLYFNDGNGKFTANNSGLPAGWYPQPDFLNDISVDMPDVNRDGAADVILGHGSNDRKDDPNHARNRLLISNGDGTFVFAPDTSIPKRTPFASAQTFRIVHADLNGDGWMDWISCNAWADASGHTDTIQIMINNQKGGFKDATPASLKHARHSWASVGDLNGDGWIDLVTYGTLAPTKIWMNNGNHSAKFTDVSKLLGIDEMRNATGATQYIGDYDGDGDQDIITLYGQGFYISENLTPVKPAARMPVPPAPALSIDSSTGSNPSAVVLSWKHAKTALYYHIQVSSDASFATHALERFDYSGNTLPPVAFNPSTKYFVRVRAQNHAGFGGWSQVGTFTTGH